MKKFKMPTAYSILFVIIIIVAILTWVIPAGQYQYTPDGEPVAGTYSQTVPNGQTVKDVLLAPFQGFYDAIDIALFILMVGGFLGVMMKTGAISAGISGIISSLGGKEKYMIPILMTVFAIGGTTFGMAEETIAFYPLVLPIFIAAGYDAVTAVAVILLGAGVGVLGSTVNPFATGIASGFAGVSLGDGLVLRLVLLVVSLLLAIAYVMKYAAKTKASPEASYVADMYEDNIEHFSLVYGDNKSNGISRRQKIALILFAVVFLVMIYSVIPFEDMGITFLPTLGWWFGELSALFFVGAIVIGVVYGLSEEDIVSSFVRGCEELLGVAFIIGISRGITVIMNSGLITDTILHWGETALSGTHNVVFTILNYLIFIPLSFLIPSSSGLATLSMPIMAPLADFSGVGRSLVITAFQCASGILNLFTPTSAVVMGALAIGRVPYDKWLKFSLKFILQLFVVCAVVLAVASIV